VTLLDASRWQGKIFSGGWRAADGGAAAAQATAQAAAAAQPARAATPYTHRAARGLDLARQIPAGIVHINDQTADDSPNTPFGGIRASGTGARFGGSANLDAFTDTRWVTVRGDIAPYRF
jgi:benzaldehyde dehydrogenase (NAD)